MRLVDFRWQGTAVGVGQQKIIGRIHMGDMEIGDMHLPTSFTILENQPMDMLLGLDMLKRHQVWVLSAWKVHIYSSKVSTFIGLFQK